MLPLAIAVLGFGGGAYVSPRDFVPGTYGISAASTNIVLRISADNKFHYTDATVRGEKLDIKGSWTRTGNTIVLKDYSSTRAIHYRWKIDADCNCLKSRKALEWRRLCMVKAE